MTKSQPIETNVGRVSRRTWLSWVGNATVMALTPDFVSACGDNTRVGQRAAYQVGGGAAGTALSGSGGVGGLDTTDTGAGRSGGSAILNGTAGATELAKNAFSPAATSDAIFVNWKGNTVDPPDLEMILATWALTIDGLVEQSRSLTFQDLLRLPRQDQITDFHCVEGWSVLDVPWNGIHIDRLIELVQPSATATHLTFHCVGDVYQDSIPLSVARESRTLLAYGIAGNTLPLTHGFPLRLVVPRLLGYKSAKWVYRIAFTNSAESGYWEQRGYGYDAEVSPARLRDGKY